MQPKTDTCRLDAFTVRDGIPVARFKGSGLIQRLEVMVYDEVKTMDLGADYMVTVAAEGSQMTIDEAKGAGQASIDDAPELPGEWVDADTGEVVDGGGHGF